jgi:hypothetical protein
MASQRRGSAPHCNGRCKRRRKQVSACRHCGKTEGTWRRRGLCQPCHEDPAIRFKYPAPNTDEYDLETGRDFYGKAAPCRGPLPADKRERERELARRATAQEELFPPDAGTAPELAKPGANGTKAKRGKAGRGKRPKHLSIWDWPSQRDGQFGRSQRRRPSNVREERDHVRG